MHGMVDIITVVMENEQDNKNELTKESFESKKKAIIAMVFATIIIAIVMMWQINNEKSVGQNDRSYNEEDIVVTRSNDEEVNDFIDDYFKAKTSLDYPRIFSMYGRDYYAEERNRKNNSFDEIVNRLKYEKVFVKSYDDIKIYVCDGIESDEKVAIVLYDLSLGFTDSKAPMILLFYLEKADDGYRIKGDMDVGTSKYIMAVSNTEVVKALYDDVTEKLTEAIDRSESLRLSYNSLRQFEMNQSVELDSLYKNGESDTWFRKLDPIKDIDKLVDIINAISNNKIAKERAEAFFENVIASLSEIND